MNKELSLHGVMDNDLRKDNDDIKSYVVCDSGTARLMEGRSIEGRSSYRFNYNKAAGTIQ